MRKGDDGGPLLAKSKESVTQIINYIVGIVGIPANFVKQVARGKKYDWNGQAYSGQW